ncbi:hypothetical protein ACFLUU_04335 [Chloroflexota bacterium]
MKRLILGISLLVLDILDVIATCNDWMNWGFTHQLPQPSLEEAIPQFWVWVWATTFLGSIGLIMNGYRAWRQAN